MPTSLLPPSRLAVLDAVRRGLDSVNALAAELGVTDNAVRLHLLALERDAYVVRTGTRRSGRSGQPAAAYQLTDGGELALTSAYPLALTALVAAMSERLELRARRALYADAGRRLAAQTPGGAHGSLARRADACAALINTLGGSATVEVKHDLAVITGAGCPIAAAVRLDPGSCTLVEALLEDHAGVRAVQRCEHGAHPHCRFHVTHRQRT